jgi:membrane protein
VHAVQRVDAYQRSHSWVGFPLGVLYKFFDDQGGYLAALITYYGFLSLFPLLLLLVTVLGYLLHGNPGLQHQILHSALSQFPIIGDQLGGDVHAAHGSVLAIVIGVLGSLYGGIGVVQAAQNAMNVVWAVPKNTRPNPIKGRLRSLLMLAVLGVGLLLTTALSGLTTGAHAYVSGPVASTGIRLVTLILAVLLNVGLFVAAFRLLTARDVTTRQVLPGAVVAAVGWQVLQAVGTYLVGSKLRGASSSYGVFGIVLGLLAFIYLAAILVVFCAEANTVAAQRLWPRSLLTPFTDDVQLTGPDQRAYSSYAAAQRSKGFQQILTKFRPHRRGADHDEPHEDQ